MRKLPLLIVAAFALGVAGTAVAAVTWPSSATTWSGINAHLNALHFRSTRIYERPERNLASVSYAVCRFSTGICSSTLCAYAVTPGP